MALTKNIPPPKTIGGVWLIGIITMIVVALVFYMLYTGKKPFATWTTKKETKATTQEEAAA